MRGLRAGKCAGVRLGMRAGMRADMSAGCGTPLKAYRSPYACGSVTGPDQIQVRPDQVRRSPVEVAKTCVSSGRGTTCSTEPFSGIARPPTRMTMSLSTSSTLAEP
ncbi:MAG: hypothetical protein QOF98_3383 [Streptomyces sp.]|nr:hypothetical protein [Streptomyces sp.]